MQIEFTPPPPTGRRFRQRAQVHLADAGPDGRLRVDGLVRFLQDVATDDWTDTGVRDGTTWVVRRTALRLVEGEHWPMLNTVVILDTWCSGSGAAWAERRTDLLINDTVVAHAAALWVPLDPQGRPRRISPAFHQVYAEAAQGRKVSGRIRSPGMPNDAVITPWALRKADLDVVDHVNNAVAWAAIVEAASGPVASAVLLHHAPLVAGDQVELHATDSEMWLTVAGEVRVSARFSTLR